MTAKRDLFFRYSCVLGSKSNRYYYDIHLRLSMSCINAKQIHDNSFHVSTY